MNTVVFVGPTLSAEEERCTLPGATFMPPAGAGDVYRAARAGATFIGIIDGYFDHRLSVWHKEVLWALSHGVRVYGAASMGALRAAELSHFGMIGVGMIFEWFRDGGLTGDDEVAIVHEPAESGYRPISEPLVNIRVTLENAVAQGVIRSETARELIALAKSLFYPTRRFATIFELAASQGLAPVEIETLQNWLGPGPPAYIDQKRLDALEMLDRMKTDSTERVAPDDKKGRDFHFEYTEVWHEFVRRLEPTSAPERPSPSDPVRTEHFGILPNFTHGEKLLKQIRDASPELEARLWRHSLERTLALTIAERERIRAEPGAVQNTSEDFRKRHGLFTPEQTERWMTHQGLDLASFSARMYDETLIAQAAELARQVTLEQVPWTLCALGEASQAAALKHSPDADGKNSPDISELARVDSM